MGSASGAWRFTSSSGSAVAPAVALPEDTAVAPAVGSAMDSAVAAAVGPTASPSVAPAVSTATSAAVAPGVAAATSSAVHTPAAAPRKEAAGNRYGGTQPSPCRTPQAKAHPLLPRGSNTHLLPRFPPLLWGPQCPEHHHLRTLRWGAGGLQWGLYRLLHRPLRC